MSTPRSQPRWQRGHKPDSVLEFVVGASSAKVLADAQDTVVQVNALTAFDEYLRSMVGVAALKAALPPMGFVEFLRNIQPVSHQTMMGNFDRHSCL